MQNLNFRKKKYSKFGNQKKKVHQNLFKNMFLLNDSNEHVFIPFELNFSYEICIPVVALRVRVSIQGSVVLYFNFRTQMYMKILNTIEMMEMKYIGQDANCQNSLALSNRILFFSVPFMGEFPHIGINTKIIIVLVFSVSSIQLSPHVALLHY